MLSWNLVNDFFYDITILLIVVMYNHKSDSTIETEQNNDY